MIIENILTPERTLCGVHGVSKKKVLEAVATLISDEVPAINAKDLFGCLVSRERLGTTGLGNGIAIPHCRHKSCTQPTGLLFQLAEPVDFEAVDQKPVDLVFALIVPVEDTQEHLEILKALASRFQSSTLLNKLREAHSSDELYDYFTTPVEIS
ncbi:PTS IIA-like nitrogen regulatory protein PtsN [Endozoicomonas sp. Mp262]|uniref:PTS IIA-like nitrogen regulatory protein PtsN n=1 Tax=Endozoicomonas sp. Mp262 TaxID=2919499 RepID=UPI0021E0943E